MINAFVEFQISDIGTIGDAKPTRILAVYTALKYGTKKMPVVLVDKFIPSKTKYEFKNADELFNSNIVNGFIRWCTIILKVKIPVIEEIYKNCFQLNFGKLIVFYGNKCKSLLNALHIFGVHPELFGSFAKIK